MDKGYFGLQEASNHLHGFGGDVPSNQPARAQTESWNGSSWTEVNDLNTARYGPHYGGGTAEFTRYISVGGYTEQAVVEQWNGSSWTEVQTYVKLVKKIVALQVLIPTFAIMAGGSTSTTA